MWKLNELRNVFLHFHLPTSISTFPHFHIFTSVFTLVFSFVFAKTFARNKIAFDEARAYYISLSGNDKDDGSKNHPWQTIDRLNSVNLKPGSSVFFAGGQTFNGTLQIDSGDVGNAINPIKISSYGWGRAIINSGNSSAIVLYQVKYFSVKNLKLIGTGRKNGNTKDGISIIQSNNIIIDSLEIAGFQKSGLLVYSSVDISVTNVYAHENGAAGIAVEGSAGKKDSRNIQITGCMAENNPGDPTNLDNHSGNGIVAGHCTNLTIDHCSATNNGWDMPRIGNGPVGIWCYESDSVTIQNCLSYKNRTSVGGADGGGFDLDGGVTNSVIQYCLSYGNQGSGYCIFQYWGASPWYNNIIRYNISENDGTVSDSHAGLYVWNSSGDKEQFYNCVVYNNTVYNSKEAALSFSEKSERKNFKFYNNIFVAKDSLIKGDKGIDVFLANDWWMLSSTFNADGMHDFNKWTQKNKVEMISGKRIGLNIDPFFKNPGNTTLTSPSSLELFDQYNIPAHSILRNNGLDLHTLYGIPTGGIDFNHKPAPPKGIGACF